MSDDHYPDNVRQLQEDEKFSFACHPGVSCFNECCRELELALTPYDVLRLRRELGLSSGQFLEQYALVEWQEGEIFPRVYLGMVDDGRASCPFVRPEGCSVYANRPAPCRTYPLGRAAFQNQDGSLGAFHVLIQEDHCQGFKEQQQQTIALWTEDQELAEYNRLNDAMMTILLHPEIKRGFRPDEEQRQLFLATLYDLDQFRDQGQVEEAEGLSDEELLQAAISWLRIKLFGFFKF